MLVRIATAEARPQAPAWRLDAFAGAGKLTNGLDSWNEFGVALGRRLGGRLHATIQADRAHRFGLEDHYLSMRLDRDLTGTVSGYVAIEGSPDAVFRPEFALRAGLQGRPADGLWSGSIDLFDGHYLSGNVQSVALGFYRDSAGGTIRLGARLIGLNDEAGDWRSGYALVGEWQVLPPTRLSLSYTDAPETSEGLTLDVRAWTAGVLHEVNDRQAVRLTLVHEDRPSYDRTAVVAGSSWRF